MFSKIPKEDKTIDTWEDNIEIYLGRTVKSKDIAALESSWVPNIRVSSVFIRLGADRGLTVGSKFYQTSQRPTISKDSPELNKYFRGKVVKSQTGVK